MFITTGIVTSVHVSNSLQYKETQEIHITLEKKHVYTINSCYKSTLL